MDFTLLGYNISRGNKKEDKLVFSLSQKKKDKIAKRLKKTFAAFQKLIDIIGYDGAAKYLFDALHVLTCNINLYNAKKGVKVGIYYSNKLLDNLDDLPLLDKQLTDCIDAIDLSWTTTIPVADCKKIQDKLIKKLKLLSFKDGFSAPHKRYKISKDRLKTIKLSWV